MASAELRHRLTAILAADVAGYSALMGADEHAALTGLEDVRAALRREIESNAGRVVDMAGDSVLALFDSATGALAAALAVQQCLERMSASVAPEGRMRVRIGLHLGEVMEKADGSVYGNGVNIAARLQSIGRPGGICISQALYDTVRSKMPVQAEPAGPQSLKNIAEPVSAWHVVATTAAPVSTAISTAAPISTVAMRSEPDPKSIAVLPFTNMSDDRGNAYFADGVQEELLTQLALLRELKVVSRTSAAEYRDTRKNIRQIGAELGVASVVEGSVRRAGDRVRVTVQLIDARRDKHLWGQSYDRQLTDIFAIQSELASEIASALKVTLSPREEAHLARKPTKNLEAYELLLRYQDLLKLPPSLSMDADIEHKIKLLSRAVELDPEFAIAWAALATQHSRAHFLFVDRTPERLRMAQGAIDRALALAKDDIEVHLEAANVYYYGYRDYERAARYLEELLRAAPNHVPALVHLSWIRRRQGRWLDANALNERTLAIDARNTDALGTLSGNLSTFRHYDRALDLQRRLVALRPADLSAQAWLRYIEYLKTGSFATYDAWRATLEEEAAQASARVWDCDVRRATLRRDFDTVLRRLYEPPKNSEFFVGWAHMLPEARALALQAKGDRQQATEIARSEARGIATALDKRPRHPGLMQRLLINRAIAGDRDAVFNEYRAWLSAPDWGEDVLFATLLTYIEAPLYAILGEREKALTVLRAQASRPFHASMNEWRASLFFHSLWDDPEFQALAADPASNAPLPIENQDPGLIASQVILRV